MDLKTTILDFVMRKADEGRINAALHAGASSCATEIAAFIEGLAETANATTNAPAGRQVAQKSEPRATVTKATLEMLRDSPDWLTSAEILQGLRSAGFDPQPETVRKILVNGVVEGALERRSHRYRARP